jgi:hypothetical protein
VQDEARGALRACRGRVEPGERHEAGAGDVLAGVLVGLADVHEFGFAGVEPSLGGGGVDLGRLSGHETLTVDLKGGLVTSTCLGRTGETADGAAMRPQRLFLKLMLWLLAASATAGVLTIFMSTSVMGRVAATALVGAIATGLAMAVSRMLDDEKKRLGGLVGLGAIVVSLVLGLAAIWAEIGFRGDLDWQFAFSATFTCIAGLVASYLLPRTGAPAFRLASWVALVTDVVALVFLLGAVWVTEEEPMQTAAFVLASGLRVGLGDSAIWARPAAIGSTGAAGACLCALSLITGGFDSDGPDALTRVAGAMGIVSACSTVAIVVLARRSRRSRRCRWCARTAGGNTRR